MGFFMGMIMGMAAGVGLVFCFARWENSRSKERMKLVRFLLALVDFDVIIASSPSPILVNKLTNCSYCIFTIDAKMAPIFVHISNVHIESDDEWGSCDILTIILYFFE